MKRTTRVIWSWASPTYGTPSLGRDVDYVGDGKEVLSDGWHHDHVDYLHQGGRERGWLYSLPYGYEWVKR